MSKGAYIGIDGVARKVKDIYIGVDGVARKIKAGYIGVNGVARPCWDGGATGAAQWETVYDMEVTTGFNSSYPKAGALSTIGVTALLGDVGATYKITINGDVHIGSPTNVASNMIYIGNPYLVNSENHEDTGEDFCVRTWATNGGNGLDWFYTRTPGTYKLKIEKQITTE